jgi:aminoglycoside/choline kinase family phosphotransferase
MIETLEEGLTRLSGERVRVRSLRDKGFTRSTSFAIQRLDVELESGDVLPVTFKDLNPLRQLQVAKDVRRLELGRSRREIWMYQHVLPRLALGTPQLYGHRWEPKRGHLWLFMEDVGRHRLGHRLDLDWYERAAAWAATFHRATASHRSDNRLPRFDAALYEARGRHLASMLDRVADESLPLVKRVLDRYGELVQLAEGLPRGMIHGEFFGKNVLIRPDRAVERIAVIDWETAATGPQYVDLASITAGRWARTQRMTMRRSYFTARFPAATGDEDWRRFNREVDIVATLEAVRWLDFWVGSDPRHAKYVSRVSRWLRELRLYVGEDVEG